VPVAYLKLQAEEHLDPRRSVATLIGAEYTFTFENMNSLALLWNQENRGQSRNPVNQTRAKSRLAELNDGFYFFQPPIRRLSGS